MRIQKKTWNSSDHDSGRLLTHSHLREIWVSYLGTEVVLLNARCKTSTISMQHCSSTESPIMIITFECSSQRFPDSSFISAISPSSTVISARFLWFDDLANSKKKLKCLQGRQIIAISHQTLWFQIEPCHEPSKILFLNFTNTCNDDWEAKQTPARPANLIGVRMSRSMFSLKDISKFCTRARS